MTDTLIVPRVIDTLEQLQHFQNSQPSLTQLRFISGTSLNRSFGVICIVYDREIDTVLIVPYFLNHSHEKSNEIGVSENPESLAMRLIAKEAVLKSKKVQELGSPIFVPDKNDTDALFPKFVVLFTDFQPEDRIKIETNSKKNGNPVWIKRELLGHIFEEKPVIHDIPREHPHYQTYQRFMEHFPLKKDLERW